MFHVLLPLLNMGEMCSIVQCDPLNLLDMIKERLHGDILSLIFCSVEQQCRNPDVFQYWD